MVWVGGDDTIAKAEPQGCPTPGACSAAERIVELETRLRWRVTFDVDLDLKPGSLWITSDLAGGPVEAIIWSVHSYWIDVDGTIFHPYRYILGPLPKTEGE